ncbi:MAG: flagellar export chaperone FlgN [Planctomycetota bacterium]
MDKALHRQLAQLEDLLRSMTRLQDRLLGFQEQKQQALRRGDAAGLGQACEAEHEVFAQVTTAEAQRQELAAAITLALDPAAKAPWGVVEIAERLPDPHRGRLLALRGELRAKLEEVAKHTGVARKACASLLNHMSGLLNTLAGAASGSGTYARNGAAAVSPHAAIRSMSLTA